MPLRGGHPRLGPVAEWKPASSLAPSLRRGATWLAPRVRQAGGRGGPHAAQAILEHRSRVHRGPAGRGQPRRRRGCRRACRGRAAAHRHAHHPHGGARGPVQPAQPRPAHAARLPGRPRGLDGAVARTARRCWCSPAATTGTTTPTGQRVAAESNEYVFVYDVRGGHPVKQQVLQVPNTFAGLAWNPQRPRVLRGGRASTTTSTSSPAARRAGPPAGAPDRRWATTTQGQGLGVRPMASGLAVNPAGTRLLVANYENDSVSLVDLVGAREGGRAGPAAGQDRSRPRPGCPGGEYPFWVVWKGDDKAYVSSVRDREVVVLGFSGDAARGARAASGSTGQPNKMILDRDGQPALRGLRQQRHRRRRRHRQPTPSSRRSTWPRPGRCCPRRKKLKGANPNDLALSPDERDAVRDATAASTPWRSCSWPAPGGPPGDGEPEAITTTTTASTTTSGTPARARSSASSPPAGTRAPSASARTAACSTCVNGKSNAGPNPEACRDTLSIAPGLERPLQRRATSTSGSCTRRASCRCRCRAPHELASLTWQVAFNNKFPPAGDHEKARGDDGLPAQADQTRHLRGQGEPHLRPGPGRPRGGNGDPSLAILSPYHPQPPAAGHASSSSSTTSTTAARRRTPAGTGPPPARATDFTEKTSPVNYAGRGLTYDWEGSNRNINVGPAHGGRAAGDQPGHSRPTPTCWPGTADVAAPDSPEGEAGAGYLWDAALRAGLTVRNYGFFVNNLGNSADHGPRGARQPLRRRGQAGHRRQAVAGAPHRRVLPRLRPEQRRLSSSSRSGSASSTSTCAAGKLPNLSLRAPAPRPLRQLRHRQVRREHRRDPDGRQRLRGRPAGGEGGPQPASRTTRWSS